MKMGRPIKDDAKKISINIRCTEEQRQEIKTKAAATGLSISEYVLKCCEVNKKDLEEEKTNV